MCLNLKNKNTKIKIAKKDIVVYKTLIFLKNKGMIDDGLSELKHGDSFTGVIKGIKCKGKISINYDSYIYLCTNNANLDGDNAYDKLGYDYSWSMDNTVEQIIVNGKNITFKESEVYQTPYQWFKVIIGETYTSKLNKIDSIVEEGLHSFATLKDAKARPNSSIVAKCIIPKGSEYYEGVYKVGFRYIENYKSYASDTLTYLEIVK